MARRLADGTIKPNARQEKVWTLNQALKAKANAIGLRAVGAERVSDEGADEITIEQQEPGIREVAKRRDYRLVGFYADDGISGRLEIDVRPEGHRLMEDAKAGKFDVVIFYNIKRIGRKATVVLGALEKLADLGIIVLTYQDGLDTSVQGQGVYAAVMAVFAENDWDSIRKTTIDGRINHAIKYGRWVQGALPFGWDWEHHHEQKYDRVPFPSQRIIPQLGLTEAEAVKEWFFRRIADRVPCEDDPTKVWTVNRVVAHWNRLGIPNLVNVEPGRREVFKWHGEPCSGIWSTQKVLDIIRTPAYYGEAEIHSGVHGRVVFSVPPLVDKDLWQRTNAQARKNRHVAQRAHDRLYPLKGLVWCDDCGCAYVGNPQRGGWVKDNGEKSIWYYYRDNSQHTYLRSDRTPHNGKLIAAHWLEDTAWQAVKEQLLHADDRVAEAYRRVEDANPEPHTQTQRAALKDRISQLEAKRDRVLDQGAEGIITMAECKERVAKVDAELTAVRASLQALQSDADLRSRAHFAIKDAEQQMAEFRALLDQAETDIAVKTRILQGMIARIGVHTEGEGRQKRATIGIVMRPGTLLAYGAVSDSSRCTCIDPINQDAAADDPVTAAALGSLTGLVLLGG